MTRRERLEKKIEKRGEWAESRAEKAQDEWGKADLKEEKSGIPLGQPILSGHHSERRHRRALERSDRAMQRAVENTKMAKHHKDKAAGLAHMLDKTIFSDDPDAVEALEAKIKRLGAERELNNSVNKIVRRKPKNTKTPDKIWDLIALGLSESTAEKLIDTGGIPAYANRNIGGRIKAASTRLKAVKQQKENREAVEASEKGVLIKSNPFGDLIVRFPFD